MPVRINKKAAATMVGAGIMLGILLSPLCALADVYVGTSVYIGTGIVVGGVTIFLIFSSGEHGRYTWNQNPPSKDPSAGSTALECQLSSSVKDLPFNEGMVTIFAR